MEIFREKFIFTRQAGERLDAPAAGAFDSLVREWSLFRWEDGLAFQFYPLLEDDVVTVDVLIEADELIKNLRGEDGTQPLTVDELNTIDWVQGWTADPTLSKRVMRTIYFCLNKDDRGLAMDLRRKLDPLIIKKELRLSDDTKEIVVRSYNILCAYFFNLLPDSLAHYLFESGFVLMGLTVGFDWEKIIKDATDKMVSLNHRQNLCIELAASLSENLTPLGQDEGGATKSIKYWIDNFRIFSKGNFGGQELFSFLADPNYLGGCSIEDKELISALLQLYTHLINGYLIVPGGDLSAVEERLKLLEESGKVGNEFAYFDDKPRPDWLIKPEDTEPTGDAMVDKETQQKSNRTISNNDIRKIIGSEFGYTPDGQYQDLGEVLARLEELAVDFNRPEIADLYYFDEEERLFKWKP